MIEPKRCPKCKSNNLKIHNLLINRTGDDMQFGCENCGYSDNQWHSTDLDALEHWNNRPIEDELQQKIDELTAENASFRDWVGECNTNRMQILALKVALMSANSLLLSFLAGHNERSATEEHIKNSFELLKGLSDEAGN